MSDREVLEFSISRPLLLHLMDQDRANQSFISTKMRKTDAILITISLLRGSKSRI
jgi:hypothetical protein